MAALVGTLSGSMAVPSGPLSGRSALVGSLSGSMAVSFMDDFAARCLPFTCRVASIWGGTFVISRWLYYTSSLSFLDHSF
jgi:hypothetical protein